MAALQKNPMELTEAQDRKQRLATMRLSVVEGIVAMIAIGLQQSFYIPFLNMLGADKLQVGIGAGLPSLVTGLIQLGIPRWLERTTSYRRVLIVSTLIHGLSFIPMALVAFTKGPLSVWYTMAFMAVNAGATGFVSACWSDWMGHLVPRRRRGVYFANRTRIVNVLQLAIVVLAGHLLDTFVGKTVLIFSLIWWTSFLTRACSSILFAWHHEPISMKQQTRKVVPIREFFAGLISHSFGRFVLAFSLINLAANFSGPFFTLYMLNDLKLSYIRYTILSLTPSLATILAMQVWGRVCDRFGYVLPMRLQVTGLMGLPLVWVITSNFWILVTVQVLAGITWGGLTLSSFGYSIGSLEGNKRLSTLSYLNCIASICIFLGTTLGGWLGPHLPRFTESQYHSIFMFSTLMRIVPVILFQIIPEDGPPSKKMTTLERFFFDPQLNLRMGFDRIIVNRFRRPI